MALLWLLVRVLLVALLAVALLVVLGAGLVATVAWVMLRAPAPAPLRQP
jgi:hypothetical protein